MGRIDGALAGLSQEHSTKHKKIEWIYLCNECHGKLLALDVELWQFTISSLVPNPCYFCGKLTQDFYEPTLVLQEKLRNK